MTNLPSESSGRNPYPCRKCGKTIYWHRAQSGKNYPCDSPTDRKDFHKCAAAQLSPGSPGVGVQKPAPTPKVITPDYFEPSLEERVSDLEAQVKNLTRTVQSVQARQPITSEDVF